MNINDETNTCYTANGGIPTFQTRAGNHFNPGNKIEF